MAGLLALVANAVLLALAVAGKMPDLATVVALLALCTVTRHVAESTARIAGLLAVTAISAASAIGGAVAGDVADLSALIAFSPGTTAAATAATRVGVSGGLIGTFTAYVTGLSASVAGFLLGR